MEYVCPLCNGIKEINEICEKCGSNMINEGPLVNFLDEYSPYLSNDITQLVDGAEHDKCMHLFVCKKCELDKRIEIEREII